MRTSKLNKGNKAIQEPANIQPPKKGRKRIEKNSSIENWMREIRPALSIITTNISEQNLPGKVKVRNCQILV